MILESILEYVIPDTYYRLPHESDMSIRELYQRGAIDGSLMAHDFDTNILEGIEACGMSDEVPDHITVKDYKHQTNRQKQFHTGNAAPSLSCSTMLLSWKREREKGPATVRMDRLVKWHHEGLLHRTEGHAALVCKNLKFEWFKDGEYYRESGPHIIKIHNLQLTFHMGHLINTAFSGIDYRWAIEGNVIRQAFIERVITEHGFKIDLFHPHNVFKNDTQEFEFYTELGAAMDPDGGF